MRVDMKQLKYLRECQNSGNFNATLLSAPKNRGEFLIGNMAVF